ncbi:hypothetical protein SAMN06269117_12123 [Balnearium lithotrophicum]|uniref:Porin domain-containing protein n=1 Tax=Balnearium lithotrophicum TaxID=223788 RepID=A0A521DI74_9BACT|nr:porin [Balnearium lithotrophicum]SMO71407.1 hypothetical protein SAMN06269117_12123 [Balnearium lithotrophicum]
MRKELILGTVFLLSSALPSFAASDYEVEQLKQMVEQMRAELQQVKEENQELREEIQKLKGTKAPLRKEKGAPSFLSKSGKKVDFYGYFKIDASYSDSKAVGTDYILFAYPENVRGGLANKLPFLRNSNDNDFNINFKHSRFGFDIKTKENGYDILGKFEFDLYRTDTNDWENNDPNKQVVRVRRAFVQLKGDSWSILAGQEWMLLTQLYPHLSNFPSGALMGNIGYRIPQIRLSKWFETDSGKFTIQTALDKEFGETDTPWFDTGSDSGLPDLQGRITYDTNLNGLKFHIGAIGHVGREQVDLADGGNKDLDSYSYGLEYKLGYGMFELSGKIWKGRNLDKWYTGGVGQGVLFIYNGGKFDTKLDTKKYGYPIDAKEIDAEGGWIELTTKFSPRLVWRIGAGVDNPDNDDLKYNGKYAVMARLKNTMYYTNLFYKLTPSIGLMGEYLRVETDYPDEDYIGTKYGDGTVNRFQGSILYFF